MSENKETPEQKLARKQSLMAKIGADFAVIEAAKSEVDKLEVDAASDRNKILKDFGPGPHAMPLPDGRKFLVTFRKAGDKVTANGVDAASVT